MAKFSRSWLLALPLLGSLGSVPVSAMTVEESDPPILRWRYYRLAETDKPLVGYVRPDPGAEITEGGRKCLKLAM